MRPVRAVFIIVVLALVLGPAGATLPSSVTLVGDLQSELGCPGDWQPDCATTHMTPGTDGIYRFTGSLPGGAYQYKVALNDSWDVNYGAHGVPGGDNITLTAPGGSVRWYFDPDSHWITDNVGSQIADAVGSFQTELGCSGDWQPDCLRSWLEDADGDGVYTFTTTALPAGTYAAKVALNETWDVNYGAGGAPNGADIPFIVSATGQKVTFSWSSTTHVLTIQAGHGADNNVEWDGLRFDSRDTLYRTPQGAVPAGTPVTIRFRTFRDDVTSVTLRDFSVAENAEHLIAMKRVATAVSCYQQSLAADTCDFWQATLLDAQTDIQWFRFIVADGTSTAYYGDDTAALDGGLGAPTALPRDWSYALTVYDPSFTTPAWARNAVVYQIFPDRFRNGETKNDPKPGEAQYDQQAILKPWNAMPEGYCRGYNTPCNEGPQGRDYFGGDLKGVRQSLDQLQALGFNTIYLNPIFWSKSNHGYDTADYKQINPHFGTLKDFTLLVQQAHALGIHIILDGVFNHMSSDSPFFDRYHHYSTVGACESTSSPYRGWFTFTNSHVPCTTGDYSGWFNFDTIPVLTKSNPDVFDYFVSAQDSVTRTWLNRGADGWRLDVMGDSSFPDDYWTRFRQVVKETDPDALIVGELWPKDSTTLKFLAGQRADSTMNYRDRDAILGFLTTHTFDGKGLGDSGRVLSPSEFSARLAAQQEDYAAPAYYDLMNLIDSHDTTRALWTLSPGAENDPAGKAAGVADGKRRLRLASLVQYTLPGMPTVYYGDEVGVTGSDDPDNRRTYPWPQQGGLPDTALQAHYAALGQLRATNPVLRDGTFTPLLADDAAGTVAYGRMDDSHAAIVAIDKGGSGVTASIPTAGFVPDGTAFHAAFSVGNAAGATFTTAGGKLDVPLASLSALVLVTDAVDLAPPAAPVLSLTGDGPGSASLSWQASAGAASYEVFRSPVTGGGYVSVGATSSTSFTDTGVPNGVPAFYVVEAVDAAGNESGPSNEVQALPHYVVDWSNLQWPPSGSFTQSVFGGLTAYGQVYVGGVTSAPGPTPSLQAQLGFGPVGSDPATWNSWVDAQFNVDSGNNDEFVAKINPEQAGSYDYAYRYTTTAGRDWVYADLDGSPNGYSSAQAGKLTVVASSDTTPPATPTGLHVTSFGPNSIALAWDAVADADVYGYEILRATSSGGPYSALALIPGTSYTDGSVSQGQTYWYEVRAVDTSWNRSGPSAPVSQLADLRTMSITFNVTVPASTDGTGRPVHIAGFLDRLDGGFPQWDPTGGTMTRVDATHWTITFTGKETTQLEYKYVLGDWNYVEKDGSCGEIANRTTTLTYGGSGSQTVNDTVLNWRNVAPCGN
jgi:glycosidase